MQIHKKRRSLNDLSFENVKVSNDITHSYTSLIDLLFTQKVERNDEWKWETVDENVRKNRIAKLPKELSEIVPEIKNYRKLKEIEKINFLETFYLEWVYCVHCACSEEANFNSEIVNRHRLNYFLDEIKLRMKQSKSPDADSTKEEIEELEMMIKDLEKTRPEYFNIKVVIKKDPYQKHKDEQAIFQAYQ